MLLLLLLLLLLLHPPMPSTLVSTAANGADASAIPVGDDGADGGDAVIDEDGDAAAVEMLPLMMMWMMQS